MKKRAFIQKVQKNLDLNMIESEKRLKYFKSWSFHGAWLVESFRGV